MPRLVLEKSFKSKQNSFIHRRAKLEKRLKLAGASSDKCKSSMKSLLVKQCRFLRKNKRRMQKLEAVLRMNAAAEEERKKRECEAKANEEIAIAKALESKSEKSEALQRNNLELSMLSHSLCINYLKTQCAVLQKENVRLGEDLADLRVKLNVIKTKHQHILEDMEKSQSAEVMKLIHEVECRQQAMSFKDAMNLQTLLYAPHLQEKQEIEYTIEESESSQLASLYKILKTDLTNLEEDNAQKLSSIYCNSEVVEHNLIEFE